MLSIRSIFSSYSKLVPSIFFISIAGILVWLSRYFSVDLDQGMLWSSAMKVTEGQVMYRDFFEFWTPGSVYLLGWLFQVFGYKLWVSQVLYVAVNLICIFLLYLVLKQSRFSTKLALTSTALFATIAGSHMALNHHWFGIACLLATLYFLLRFHNDSQCKLYFIGVAGLMAGLAALFMQYEGAIAVLSALYILTFLPSKVARTQRLMAFLIPIILLALVAVTYFALNNALIHFVYSTIYFPLTQYKEANSGLPSILWLYQTLVLVLLAWLFHHQRMLTSQFKIIISVAAFIQLAGLSTVGYMHTFLFGFLVNSLYVYACFSLLARAGFRKKWQKIGFRGMFIRVVNFIDTANTRRFATVTLLGLFILIYGARLGEGVSVLWSSRLQIIASAVAMQTPAGKLHVPSEIYSRMSRIIEYTESNSRIHQQVYFGPYSSYYNLLTGRQNPIPYSQITPGYNPEPMFENAVNLLKTSETDLIFWLPRESYFPIGKENKLYKYIQNNYEVVVELPEIPFSPSYSRPLDQEPPDAIWARKDIVKSSEY